MGELGGKLGGLWRKKALVGRGNWGVRLRSWGFRHHLQGDWGFLGSVEGIGGKWHQQEGGLGEVRM